MPRARTARRLSVALVAALTLAVAILEPAPSHAAFPGADGRIAFVRDADIWFVQASGAGLVNVTSHAGEDDMPAFSADGTRLAFATNRFGTGKDIAVRDADGTITQLTSHAADDTEPAWSPDGTKIAFTTTRSGFREIWLMDADGTDQTLLVAGASGSGRGNPSWSPDGQWIAYDTSGMAGSAIVKVRPTGADATTLVGAPDVVPINPDWAPDGAKVAFWSSSLSADGKRGQLWTAAADGSDAAAPVQLTSGTAFHRTPAFAPSGTSMAFTRAASQGVILSSDLYVGDASAASPVGITTGGNNDAAASWGVLVPTPPIVALTAPAAESRTQDTTPAISGIAGTDTGDGDDVTVKVYAGASATGTPLQTLTTSRNAATGVFSVEAAALTEGTYTVQAEQADDESSVGRSGAITFHVDLTAPAPTVEAPAESETLDDASPWIEGTATEGAGDGAAVRILVYAGSTATGTPVADVTTTRGSGGAWRQWVGPLPNGSYTAVARQADLAGHTGESTARHFAIAATSPGGRIAFQRRDASSREDIWTVRPDGTGLLNVTQSDASDIEPAWSPDGTRLAFATDRWGDHEIAVREHDGTVSRLTTAAGTDSEPAFSPDGTKIAFSSWRAGHQQIWVMDADGSDPALLVDGGNGQSRAGPVWSPDGEWIAYTTNEMIDAALYKIRLDGTQRTTLARDSVHGVTPVKPDWAPDGQTVRFWASSLSGDPAKQGDMWTAQADGSGVTRFSSDPAFERGPVHGPGGRQVVFAAPFGGASIVFGDLWIMDLDGSGRTRLTTTQLGDEQPAWQSATAIDEPEVSLSRPRDSSRTNDTTPTVEGRASRDPGDAADVTIKVHSGSGRSGPLVQEHDVTWSPATGEFSKDLDPLPAGTYTVVAEQTGSGGAANIGTSTAHEFVVDLTAPVVAVSAPSEGQGLDDASPWIEGTAGEQPGDVSDVRVRVYPGPAASGTAVVDVTVARQAGGAWREWVGPLPDGEYTARVTQADTAGNSDEVVRHFDIDAGPATGRIAFHREDGELYAIRADGTGLVNLTNDAAADEWPAWSPDGTRMAFATDRYGAGMDIAIREPDGGVTRVTTSAGDDTRPAFSPDGAKIAFETTRDGFSEIWVMNSDGTGQAELVAGASGQGRTAPSWSPDGAWIAYASLEPGDQFVKKVRPNGADTTILAQRSVHGVMPAEPEWSPDGASVRFWSTSLSDDGKQGDLWTAAADGTGVTRLSGDPAFERGPTHSPDGTQVAFSAPLPLFGILDSDLWVMDLDGSGRRRLTTAAGNDAQMAWQPAGAAPAVSIAGPAADDDLADATPEVTGVAGTAPGDASTVTVRVHRGTKRTGELLESVPVTRDPGTGAFAATLGALDDGRYTVVAAQEDDQGNTGRSSAVTFRVDTTAPEIAVTAPATGGSYVHGTPLAADYACTDTGGSGVATCAGPVADGASLDTSAPGARTFSVTATDAAGNDAVQEIGYTVTNAAPAVSFTAPDESVTEGSEVTYAYTTSDGDGDGVSVTSTSCGDAATTVAATAGELRCRFGDGPSTSNVSVTVTDGIEPVTGDVAVDVVNAPPVAVLDGPSSGTAGQPLSFDAGRSTDPGGDALTYAWDFTYTGVFGAEADGPLVSPTFAAPGTPTVALRVTDADGAVAPLATRSVTVTAAPGDGDVPTQPAPDPSAPGGGSTSPPPPPPAPPAAGDTAAPVLTIPRRASYRLRDVLRGLRFPVRCSEACRVSTTVALEASSRSRRARAAAPRLVTVARGAAKLARAGRVTLRLRPTQQGRRALRKVRQGRLRITTVASDAHGNRVTKRARVKLRR